MADTQREIERKYVTDRGPLPDLTGVAGVAAVRDEGVEHLDATYYDTADQRLAAARLTLRRRTGGRDAGWHLKLPVAPGVREEIHAPLSDEPPPALTALVRSRARELPLAPVVRLRTERDLRHLVDAEGALLAEASVDTVHAERLTGDGGTARWTEIEVELAPGGDPAFLDTVEERLREAGVRPADSPSKLARALADTGAEVPRAPAAGPPGTAGDHVLAYVREQVDALVDLDPGVRRDAEDAVHRMRVATRRLRSVFRSYGKVLDRRATEPLRAELKWLAGELGVDRDREVLTERLTGAFDGLPARLRTGPVRGRLHAWSDGRHAGARERLLDALDSDRYLALLASLDALAADPPLRPAAARKPEKVLAKAVRKDTRKVADRIGHALGLSPGPELDVALHEARKKAKRARYAAEAAVPALGERASRVAGNTKRLTKLLGEHQDAVMAREALLDIADAAQAAGESSFTWGLLYGREERGASAVEAQLPRRWAKIGPGTAL
ncbi:CHAD domain-containing protein [Streptomyces sp. NPDC008150]|uniref:CYTH and CHAD domain-containing protein n=1 Tax=Streptomyces sp. NPDC008150 TaxID=3364816 RepID=UPI0036E9E67A